jgi:hypothetical protein
MRALWFAVVGLSVSVVAQAQETPPVKASDVLKAPSAELLPSPINDRFALRAGFFSAGVSTDLRLDDSDTTLGTELSAEEDLGLRDDLSQGRAELTIRMLRRNRIRVDYFKLTRRGDQVLSRTIEFGDETFTANEQVLSFLDWRMLNLSYLYSLLQNQRFELGLGATLHILEAEARARVPNQALNEEKSGVAGFPTVAVDAAWRISPRFALTARANYLSASVDESSGSIADYHANLQFRWAPNLSVGLGYTVMNTEIDIVDDDDISGRFAFDIDGPELFIRASF